MPLTGSFEQCFVALLAELWAELEAVLGASDAGEERDYCSRRRAELRAEALLLELVLLADRCDSARWQSLLGATQVERLRVVVGEVHRLLDFAPPEHDSEEARRAIVRAQNLLFDEVCRAIRGHGNRAGGAPADDAQLRVARSA
jgi:hypothetical protein